MAKKIDIGGELHSTATGNIVADAKEIKYRPTGKEEKTQAQVNDELIEAVGSGGGVDARIANAVNDAKAEIRGNATSACDTLGEAEALISAETSARQSAISNVIGDAASDYNTLGKLEDKIQAEATRAEAAEGALDGRIDTLETAVGTGGSVDSRISAAVAIETTRAQQAESSLSTGKADKATTLAGYGITDAYTKTEINDHIDTPNQGYITAVADSNTTTANLKSLIDTAAGSDKEKAEFIYRVGCWDGSQYNDTMYSEYAWIDTDYVFLSKKPQIDEVFDISAYHANTPYVDLAAALGTNGENVPQPLRKGGMSVKFEQIVTPASYTVVKTEGLDSQPTGTEIFSDPDIDSGTYSASQLSAFSTLPESTGAGNAVTYWMEVTGDTTTYTSWVITMAHSSDNKYVQFRLTATDFSTDVDDWEENVQTIYSGSDGDDSISFVDGEGNCAMQVKGGHVKTKNFDSRDAATKTYVNEKAAEIAEGKVDDALEKVPEVDNAEDKDDELAFVDEDGNCNLLVSEGHMKTKHFDSRNVPNKNETVAVDNVDENDESLAFIDDEGNCPVQIKNGHIKTKHFDSRKIKKQESFLSLSNSDLTIIGTSHKNVDGSITLTSGVSNKAYINSVIQNWHYTMLAKFRCTGGVSFVIGKDRTDYGAKVEVVKDGSGSYVKFYSVTSNGQGGYVVGLVHTATLDFTLNENEDYLLSIKSDVDTAKYWTIELIGEFNEYFTENTKDLQLPNTHGYGKPYVYTDATSCVLNDYRFSINRYYDVKNAKVAVFGHSLVEADSLGAEREDCFANLLAEAVGETKCPNFGLGGLQAQQLIDMLRCCLPLTKNIQYGMICIGGNDGSQTSESLIGWLQQMCQLMESYEITPILCTEHPWSEGVDPNNPSQRLPPIFRPNITAMNNWIRNSGYLYCDEEQVFVDVDIVNGNPTDSNIRTDLYLWDMTHPTVQGHHDIFNRIMMDCPYLF